MPNRQTKAQDRDANHSRRTDRRPHRGGRPVTGAKRSRQPELQGPARVHLLEAGRQHQRVAPLNGHCDGGEEAARGLLEAFKDDGRSEVGYVVDKLR